MLGRGGYGLVYRVRHRLDNQLYAVKKVPLNMRRLQQVRGNVDVEDMLREIRALARLDHPNIVRYFSGWIEWIDISAPALDNVEASRESAVGGAELDVVFEVSSYALLT